ncbi:MAG: FAD-dependent oxidoreductase [Phycisphaerae bacterium]
MTAFPTQARVVVVGGGIMGCSTAYYLAKMGWKEVVLLERAQLTSGATWHAAGLVGQLRSSATITQLLGHSVALYDTLEAETGHATGWKMSGGLRLACNEERMTELKRQATTARSFGLEMHLLTPSEAKKMWPLMEVSDLVGAAFIPTDGSASPSDITAALAKGARMHGAQIIENCPVTGVEQEKGRVSAVLTEQGRMVCEYIVNCGGQWAAEFGRLAGVRVPLVPVQHQFMVTEPIDGVTPDLPTLRDPDRLTYYKEEVGGLIMGGYERNPKPWAMDGIPKGFVFQLLEPDFDHFHQLAELALPRVPALETAGVQKLVNGPEAFTPDGYFLLGEAPELKNYYVGTGFNAFGIAAAGGAGKALAEWMLAGEPPYDLWRCDIRRFSQHHDDVGWVRKRTLELYGKHYTMAWPFEEHDSGRPLRRSPLYDTLKAAGACFGEKQGWERPNWFAPKGVEAKDIYSFGRQNWFEHVGEEHRAVRERVGVFDQTSFANFVVVGRDAEAALSWICANDVSKPAGRLTYTEMLNSRGGIECDLTVSRLAEDRFYITTGTAFGTHDTHWIESNIPEGLDAHLFDVTSSNAVLGVMGPRARDVLSALTDADLSNEAFPFASVRRIHVAGAPLLALRVTYVGELGWELHVPMDFALTLYQALMEAGASYGIVNAGYRAIDSMRLEKGYRLWGVDITPDDTPLEAGLGWAVKLKTDIPFHGREALLKQKQAGVKKRLACFTVDDPNIMLLGRETIFRNGERVGWLTSGGWGYTVEKSMGFGYVRNPDGVDHAYVLEGSYELEVARERVPAEVQLDPLYDPKMVRIKA